MANNEDFSIEKFSPAKAEVLKVVEAAKKTDLTNIEEVHKNRIMVRDMRIDITKRGKELREGALKFQKEVISREKELLDEIEPIETLLEDTEEEAKLKKEMEKRRAELPTRLAALATIGDDTKIADDELLKMDDNEFNEYRLQRIDLKLAADKRAFDEKKAAEEKAAKEKTDKELADRRAALDKEEREARAKREAEDRAVKEKYAIEEKRQAEEKAKIDAEKARLAGIEEQRLKEESAKKAEVERQEREAKLKADEDARRAKEAAFLAYLKTIGYDGKTDKFETQTDGSMKVWRLIGTYTPKK